MKEIKTRGKRIGRKAASGTVAAAGKMKTTALRLRNGLKKNLESSEQSSESVYGAERMTEVSDNMAQSAAGRFVRRGKSSISQVSESYTEAKTGTEKLKKERERRKKEQERRKKEKEAENAAKAKGRTGTARKQEGSPASDGAGEPKRRREESRSGGRAGGSDRDKIAAGRADERKPGRRERRDKPGKKRPARGKRATPEERAAEQAKREARRKARAAARARFKRNRKTALTAVRTASAAVRTVKSALTLTAFAVVMVVVVISLIGLIVGSGFGIFFSGEAQDGDMSVSGAVREINMEYQAKLEQIEEDNPHDVLEITGTRAQWPEILAVYAVRVTADPVNGQEAATMTGFKREILEEIFWSMNDIAFRLDEVTETVADDEDTDNETQVTITYLRITVKNKTAAETADAYGFTQLQMVQLNELLSDDNASLWNSVIYGIPEGTEDLVSVAVSQIGNTGGEIYWSWYGYTSRVDWCACFVSWCAEQCGHIDAGEMPMFSSCSAGVAWFKSRGQWKEPDAIPVPGMIVFFDWNDDEGGQDGNPDHVGIVEKVENGLIYTVEGNSGDSCRERSYLIGHFEILGYGVLNF